MNGVRSFFMFLRCAAGEPSGIGIVPRFSRILPRIGDARKEPTIRTCHLVHEE